MTNDMYVSATVPDISEFLLKLEIIELDESYYVEHAHFTNIVQASFLIR